MDRIVFHSDCNAFYASVECLYRTELRKEAVAVAGDPQLRHGIILTKNEKAKKAGVITGETIQQAKSKCPNLIVVPPNYPLYLRFSHLTREIYREYTDRIEPYGLDEAWLDLSQSVTSFTQGISLANLIRKRILKELGITVSIGVSYNKVYAKLGSDYKKPNAVTSISKENHKQIVYPLPAAELLYVGRATREKLRRHAIYTIGDIANCEEERMIHYLGKNGQLLRTFARGEDTSSVALLNHFDPLKSIGNSTTTPHDLHSIEEVRMTLCILCESVAARLRENGLVCRVIHLHVRDCALSAFEKQSTLPFPSNLSSELQTVALRLFSDSYIWQRPIRSLGVSVTTLLPEKQPLQLSLFTREEERSRKENAERAVDEIRRRFGQHSLQKALLLKDSAIGNLNPKEDHILFPTSYLGS